MYRKEEYIAYVNDYIQTHKDDETAYKGEEPFKTQFKAYVKYLLENINDLYLDEKEQVLAVTQSIKRGFHSFKSYEEFTRNEKIEKLLK